MASKCDILIVHANGAQVLRNCLKSIYKNTKNIDVYVLLNASTDNSREMLEKEFSKVRIIESKRNIGFAQASNILAKNAKSEYIVFLNNDTVVEKGWLDEMLKTMKRHKNCVVCQPKIKSYHERDKFEYAGAAGGFIDIYGYPFCRGRIFEHVEKDTGQYNDEVRVFWACGVCMLVKRDFFINSGMFDEDFFMYAEELDFCWRANLYGKEAWYSPKSTIYHIGSFTAKGKKIALKKDYYITRNHILLLLKNYSAETLARVMPVRIAFLMAEAIRFFPKRTLSVFRSLAETPFIYMSKMRRKRSIIQKNRKLSDKELSKLMLNRSISYSYFLQHKKTFKELLMN